VLLAALAARRRHRPRRALVHGSGRDAALAHFGAGSGPGYHAGVEAKIFEGFTQCTALAKGASTADLLKQITHAPLVRCDEVQFRFLGISMAGWNAILSLGGAALILLLSLRSRRA